MSVSLSLSLSLYLSLSLSTNFHIQSAKENCLNGKFVFIYRAWKIALGINCTASNTLFHAVSNVQ